VKLAQRKEAPLPPPFRWRTDLLPALYTIHAFTLGAIFFRAASFTDAWNYLMGIVSWRPGPVDMNALAVLVAAAIFSFGIDILQRNTRDETFAISWPAPARALTYATLVLAIMVFSGGTPIPFIYFQF
jgi:hypothetical protein